MKPILSLRHFLLVAGSSLLALSSAHASIWTNITGGTQQWNTATNWDTNPTVPNGIGAVANLSVNLGAAQTVNLATAVTLGSLTYGDSTSAFVGQTIQGGTITFNNSGSGASLTQASTAATAPGIISNNVVLNDNLTIVNNGTNTDRNNAMQLSGVISGTGGIRLNAGGGGAVFVSNSSNNYSGGVTFNHSTAKFVSYNNGDAFGTGVITFNAAGVVDTSAPGGGALLLTTSNTNVWNSGWTLAGSSSWNSNGNVTLGTNTAISRGAHLSLGGNIGETGGARSLTLNSAASSVFNGTNTYTGGTTVAAGSLAFLKTASMPSTGAVSFANGTTLGIGLGGDGWTSIGTGAGTLAGVFQGTNVGVGPSSSTFSYTTAVGLNLIVTGNHSFGVIENLGSSATAFTKSGIGNLTMNGDNTYTGATTVQGGGGLVLDYATSNFSKFASATALTLGGGGNTSTGMLGGGSITLKGGSFTEVVSATSLNAGQMTIARDGGTAKLQLNAIARTAGGTVSFADATIATTDTNNFGTSGANGILGGWATIGNDWAVSANTGAADTAITALSSYTTFVNTGGSATANYLLNGTDTLTGAVAAGTLKITDSGAGQSLSLGANNLTITSSSATALGGIMYAGGTTGSYTINGAAGRIATSTVGTTSVNQELILAVQSGTLTINALFANNSIITKTGVGTLVLGGTNTNAGNIFVNEGVLRLNNAAASGVAGSFGGLAMFVQNGAALELTGGLSYTDGERVMISGSGISNGGALRSVSGNNTWRGLIEVAIGGARINSDAGTLTINRGITTVSGGDVTFGGAGNITVNTPLTTPVSVPTYGSQAINGGGGLIKDGAGTLTLTGSNNYVGPTTVNAGKLIVNGNISTSLVTVAAAGTLAGTGTVGGNTTISGTHSPGNSPGVITHSSNLTYELGSNVIWELVANSTGSRGTNFDGINVGNTLSFNGATTLGLNFDFGASTVDWSNAFWAINYTGTGGWLVYSGATSLTGFANLGLNAPSFWLDESGDSLASIRSGASFSLFQDGNNIYLNYAAVPEPNVAALLGSLGVFALLRRRR